ncbi:MAG TPA: cytidylate kinase-like family protein [Anaerolineales bacterium]
MSVITISRQYGSGGDEIAELICHNTGYQLFDKHILARAAFEAGISDQEVIDYSEDNYMVKNFLARLFGISRPIAQLRVWKEGKDGVRVAEEIQLNEEHALSLVRKAIEYAYEIGNIVIMGRGGQVILKDKPDVIHVRIEADIEDRLVRVRSYPEQKTQPFSDSVEARRAAQDIIESFDTGSADYLKRFYGVDSSDPLLYHFIINTSKFSIEHSANLITQVAQQIKPIAEPA